MKKGVITYLLLILGISLQSQTFGYEIRKTHSNSIKKEIVNSAQKMSDLIPFYPSEWLSNYISVELVYRREGKPTTLESKNEILSTEQKNILKTADIGDDITININYFSKNAINDKLEVSKMHYETSIDPFVEAEYEAVNNKNAKHDESDGRTYQYIKNSIINKIPEATQKQLNQTLIRFTVSEEGQVIFPKIYQSSGDKNIDKLIIEALSNMPKWKPAQSANGTKVKQQFEFRIGSQLGGC